MKRSRDIQILMALGIFAVVAILLYWLAWFAAPVWIQSRSPSASDYAIYVNFEQAFPLADGWLALSALMGVIGLWKMREWGFLFMLLAGGAAIFLGCMDLLYDLEHNMFSPLTPEAIIELIIVIAVLALGPLVVVLTWKNRRAFVH